MGRKGERGEKVGMWEDYKMWICWKALCLTSLTIVFKSKACSSGHPQFSTLLCDCTTIDNLLTINNITVICNIQAYYCVHYMGGRSTKDHVVSTSFALQYNRMHRSKQSGLLSDGVVVYLVTTYHQTSQTSYYNLNQPMGSYHDNLSHHPIYTVRNGHGAWSKWCCAGLEGRAHILEV